MTSRQVVALAEQARSDLLRIQAIPALTDAERAECRRLVADADQLADLFGGQQHIPGPLRAWLTGLRAILARGCEIERKYRP